MVNPQELDFHNYFDGPEQAYQFTGFQDGQDYSLEHSNTSHRAPVNEVSWRCGL